MQNDEMLKKLAIICKLLYMQVKPKTERLKEELKLTQKQKQVYELCNGKNSLQEIAKKAKCSERYVKRLLPEWEKMGLIISTGKGAGKRYVNIENLEV
jgi:DNA-binding MarR family transcriptional regulator